MSNVKYVVSILAIVASTTCYAAINDQGQEWTPRSELSSQIPEIKLNPNKKARTNVNFVKVPEVAQYGSGDWSQVVGIARGISEDEAIQIAKSNPKITFFFRTKGFQMILVTPQSDYRRFGYGDTVFFTGSPHWGSAPNLADGYVMQ